MKEKNEIKYVILFLLSYIHRPNTIGKGRQGVVENNAGDAIWDAWPAYQDHCCKYLEAQQFFLWFYIPNFQCLCLSFLLLISSLLHDYSSLFLFLALHFVIYLMDGWLIMGTSMWLKFLWFYCYGSFLGFLFEGDRDKFWESSCFTSSGFFEFVQKILFQFGRCFLL